jgi:hypothetical protein
VERRLKIFHYGDNITINTDKFAGNIFMEDGIFKIDKKGKIAFYGNLTSGGDLVELKIKSGNIELLGYIYAPYANLKIESNNLFIDRGSLVGYEVWINGHYKIKNNEIGNSIEE